MVAHRHVVGIDRDHRRIGRSVGETCSAVACIEPGCDDVRDTTRTTFAQEINLAGRPRQHEVAVLAYTGTTAVPHVGGRRDEPATA